MAVFFSHSIATCIEVFVAHWCQRQPVTKLNEIASNKNRTSKVLARLSTQI